LIFGRAGESRLEQCGARGSRQAKARHRELTAAFGKLLRGKLAESVSGLAALIFLEILECAKRMTGTKRLDLPARATFTRTQARAQRRAAARCTPHGGS